MIKYFEAGPKDLLPTSWIDTDEVAISYALQMAMSKLKTFIEKTRLYGDIDHMPEDILDLMALELRTQYYDETLEIEKKRDIIRNTLAWYEKAGTTSAVEQMVTAVFSGANVIEWQNMKAEDDPVPGTFAVEVIDNDSAGDRYKELREIIKNVKMASAHLAYLRRIIEIIIHMETTNHVYLTKIRIGMRFPYWRVHRLDGSWPLDGSVRLNGLTINMPVNMKIKLPVQGVDSSIVEAALSYIIRTDLSSGIDPISREKLRLGITFSYWKVHRLDGSWPLDGSVRLNGLTVSMPASMRIKFKAEELDDSDISSRVAVKVRTYIDEMKSSLNKVAFLVVKNIDTGKAKAERVRSSISMSLANSNKVSVSVTTRKNVWYLDGSNALDGTQILNASIIKEDI